MNNFWFKREAFWFREAEECEAEESFRQGNFWKWWLDEPGWKLSKSGRKDEVIYHIKPGSRRRTIKIGAGIKAKNERTKVFLAILQDFPQIQRFLYEYLFQRPLQSAGFQVKATNERTKVFFGNFSNFTGFSPNSVFFV
jgi:hypothetical protein